MSRQKMARFLYAAMGAVKRHDPESYQEMKKDVEFKRWYEEAWNMGGPREEEHA